MFSLNVHENSRFHDLEKGYKGYRRELPQERTDTEGVIKQLKIQTEANKVLESRIDELQKKLQIETKAKDEALTRYRSYCSWNSSVFHTAVILGMFVQPLALLVRYWAFCGFVPFDAQLPCLF